MEVVIVRYVAIVILIIILILIVTVVILILIVIVIVKVVLISLVVIIVIVIVELFVTFSVTDKIENVRKSMVLGFIYCLILRFQTVA